MTKKKLSRTDFVLWGIKGGKKLAKLKPDDYFSKIGKKGGKQKGINNKRLSTEKIAGGLTGIKK